MQVCNMYNRQILSTCRKIRRKSSIEIAQEPFSQRLHALILLSIITIVCYTVNFESTLKEGHSGHNVKYAITFKTYFKNICGKFDSCACELCRVGEDKNNLAH